MIGRRFVSWIIKSSCLDQPMADSFLPLPLPLPLPLVSGFWFLVSGFWFLANGYWPIAFN